MELAGLTGLTEPTERIRLMGSLGAAGLAGATPETHQSSPELFNCGYGSKKAANRYGDTSVFRATDFLKKLCGHPLASIFAKRA